jgi:hypothetical protein
MKKIQESKKGRNGVKNARSLAIGSRKDVKLIAGLRTDVFHATADILTHVLPIRGFVTTRVFVPVNPSWKPSLRYSVTANVTRCRVRDFNRVIIVRGQQVPSACRSYTRQKGFHQHMSKTQGTNLMCSMPVHSIIQKTLNTNECTKSFFVNYNTLLHVSTLLGHLQGETAVHSQQHILA